MPLDHPSGEAQVDFGDVVFYEKGQKVEGHELLISFPFSNGSYAQLLKGENQECLFTGMRDIFEYMKKVPTVIWFDNLSAAVAGLSGQDRILTERFQRFCLHYGFEGRFCNPDAGHEKGNVENTAAGTISYRSRSLRILRNTIRDFLPWQKRTCSVITTKRDA